MQYDMEELLEQANEVQEMLGRSYAVPDELDEADLEAGTLFCTKSQFTKSRLIAIELEALAMEPEEEEISYLTDINKVPDFIDDPPVETHEVSICFFCVLIVV